MTGPNLAPPTDEIGLFTDLYELTMAQAYFRNEMFAPATFSLFVRSYPPNRAYFVSAGLEDVLEYLSLLNFGDRAVAYLRSTSIFGEDFLEFLRGVRFTGSVRAIPEGRLFFADEPILEVTAPIIEAQLVETYVINQVNLQSTLATKASRCVWAAQGRGIADFASRRTQGTDAAMKMARPATSPVSSPPATSWRPACTECRPPAPWPIPSFPASPRKSKPSGPMPSLSPPGPSSSSTPTTPSREPGTP